MNDNQARYVDDPTVDTLLLLLVRKFGWKAVESALFSDDIWRERVETENT